MRFLCEANPAVFGDVSKEGDRLLCRLLQSILTSSTCRIVKALAARQKRTDANAKIPRDLSAAFRSKAVIGDDVVRRVGAGITPLLWVYWPHGSRRISHGSGV